MKPPSNRMIFRQFPNATEMLNVDFPKDGRFFFFLGGVMCDTVHSLWATATAEFAAGVALMKGKKGASARGDNPQFGSCTMCLWCGYWTTMEGNRVVASTTPPTSNMIFAQRKLT